MNIFRYMFGKANLDIDAKEDLSHITGINNKPSFLERIGEWLIGTLAFIGLGIWVIAWLAFWAIIL